MRKLLCVIVLLSLSFSLVAAQDSVTPPDPSQYQFEEVTDGISWPVYVTNAGDGSGRLFALSQVGIITIIQDGVKLADPFLDITSLVTQGIRSGYTEQGLLGLAFHPDFAENGEFFVHYNRAQDGMTVIARYHVSADDPNKADPSNADILLTQEQPYSNHDGGQIAFGPDGYLYIGLGDGGSAGDPQNHAQDPQSQLGKILRIDVDGDMPYGIPADNPANTVNQALLPQIWAWGLRNPYRFSFDSATGDLYIGDVGQNQWEEIDYQAAGSEGGQNYGWRVWEATHLYSPNDPDPGDTVPPVLEYSHADGCSVTGGYVYRGEALPALDGVYFYGDYCSGTVWSAYRDAAGEWQSQVFKSGTGMNVTSFGRGRGR